MKPICTFVVAIGDKVMDVIHKFMIGQEHTVIKIDLHDGNPWRIILTAIGVIGGALLIVAASIITFGIADAIIATVGLGGVAVTLGSIAGIAITAVVGGIAIGAYIYDANFWDDETAVIPLYVLTPEEIFGNNPEMPLFSVNFFDEAKIKKPIEAKFWVKQEETSGIKETTIVDTTSKKANSLEYNKVSKLILTEYTEEWEKIMASINDELVDKYKMSTNQLNPAGFQAKADEYKQSELSTPSNGDIINIDKQWLIPTKNNYYYKLEQDPNLEAYTLYKSTTPFDGEKEAGGDTTGTKTTEDETGNEDKEVEINLNESNKNARYPFAYSLRSTIAAWYRVLRTIAAVGMMSVLIYIGIRILLSSTSNQKAKYKELLGDWVIGMVLLFSMHFIMAFSNAFVDELSNFLNGKTTCVYIGEVEDKDGKVSEALTKYEYNVIDGDATENKNDVLRYEDKDGKRYIQWNTNLTGQIRMNAGEKITEDGSYVGATIMFVVCVIFTISFMFTYTKRVMYMAFLTLISPLVALTYPIDKVNDGKAQGFNFWFKEYIFNLLLQPMHLLLYTILFSSAINIATTNWVYALVVIGFIANAEKILRKMFNFEKASTPGMLSGPAGAAITMTGMRALFGHTPHSKGGEGRSDSGSRNLSGNGGDSGRVEAKDMVNTVKGIQLSESGDAPSNTPPVPPPDIPPYTPPDTSPDVPPNTPSEEESPNNTSPNTPPIRLTQTPTNNGNDRYSDENIWKEMFNRSRGRRYRELKYADDRKRKEEVDKYRRKKQKIDKAKGTVSDTWDFYKSGMQQKFKRKLKNAKPGRQLAKMVGGAAGAAAFGTVGVAAGIASGDVSKTFQYATAGTAGGYKLGSGATDAVRRTLTVEGTGEQFQRSMLGEDAYWKMKKKEKWQDMKNDENIISKIQKEKKYTRKEARNWLEENGKKYYDEKIENIDDMLDIDKTIGRKVEYYSYFGNRKKKEFEIKNQKEAIAAYKASQMFRTASVNGHKKEKELIERIKDITGSDIEAEKMLRLAGIYDDTKFDRYNENVIKNV